MSKPSDLYSPNDHAISSHLKARGQLTFWRLHVAEPERIAGVARATRARRQVVHDLAICVGTAGSRTWILALVAYARPVGGAVRIQDALWTTAFVRVTHIVGEATAGACSVLFPTNCVRAARRRHAGSRPFLRELLLCKAGIQEVSQYHSQRNTMTNLHT